MGVLLDSTFLIDAERRGLSVTQTLLEVEARVPAQDCGISVVSVMEMAHGEARAASNARASIRALFLTDLMAALQVHPVTAAIARAAGRLDGSLTKRGEPIAFPDLIIGRTALDLGYRVVTRNLRHFQRIPGLTVIQRGKPSWMYGGSAMHTTFTSAVLLQSFPLPRYAIKDLQFPVPNPLNLFG